MKRSTKIILTGLMAVLACVTLLLGCVPQEAVAPAENQYNKVLGGYTSHPQDPRMTVDGVLDEELWEGKDWFTNVFMHDLNGVYPKFKVTGFPTDYGIYVAAVTDDTNIVNNTQRNTSKQSNFEFEITADTVGEERVNDRLYKTKYVFDLRGDSYSRNPNVDRAVVVNGEVNSGNTQGATLEFFIAWEELGVDVSKGIPTEFRMQCTYRAMLPGETWSRDMVSTSYTSTYTKDFFRFDKDGYTTADREGAKIGDSIMGHNKTANWDISREAEGIVQSSVGTEKHIIFFKEHYGSDFIIETTIVPVKTLGDPNPMAGIYLQATNSYNSNYADYYAVLLQGRESNLVDGPNGTKNFKTYFMTTLHPKGENGGRWVMTTVPGSKAATNPNAETQEGVKLTVIKYGSKLAYFCDGQFMAMDEVDFMDTEIIPGFYTLHADAIFKDYSCKPIDEKGLKDYLGGEGVYLIDAMAGGSQGTVTASKPYVMAGKSVDITITTKPGFRVSSVMINGEEKLADVQASAVGGVYTITNIGSHKEIRVGYERIEGGVQFTGTVTDGTNPIAADARLIGITDPTLRYTFSASAAKGFDIKIPAGTYELVISATEYKPLRKEIVISDDMSGTYALEESDFMATVKVNNTVLPSSLNKWDLSGIADGKLTTSFAAGGSNQPLYFKTPAADFAVEITAKYTTEFVAGVTYQKDLMAGFRFNDGSNKTMLCVSQSGIVFTNTANKWTWRFDLSPNSEKLLYYAPAEGYEEPKPVTFGVAKVGDDVYIYINGRVSQKKWSEVAAGMDPTKEVAIGLTMFSDYAADLEISNYKLMTGAEAAQEYIDAHK